MHSEVVEALGLPLEARINQRVPKKLMLEQGAPTPGDKRSIQEGIEELTWIAALKPTNIGVPAYRDEAREYVEIAVLTGTFRPDAKSARLTELVHRAIPYPLLLIASQDESLFLSLAHKRFSQAESGAVVLEGSVATVTLLQDSSLRKAFLESMGLATQPAENLFSVYQGWLAQIETLAAAQITGRFMPAKDTQAVVARRAALANHTQIQSQLVALRGQASKEKQIKRRVELNLEIRRLETSLGKLTNEL